jgi:hypothetical protein
MAPRCSFCGATRRPFTKVEGLFEVLICVPTLPGRPRPRQRPLSGDDPLRDAGRAGHGWRPALEQKAAANRQVIDIMRRRLAAGEEVARMYQEPGLAWLERQAEVAEDLVAERQAAVKRGRRWYVVVPLRSGATRPPPALRRSPGDAPRAGRGGLGPRLGLRRRTPAVD